MWNVQSIRYESGKTLVMAIIKAMSLSVTTTRGPPSVVNSNRLNISNAQVKLFWHSLESNVFILLVASSIINIQGYEDIPAVDKLASIPNRTSNINGKTKYRFPKRLERPYRSLENKN